MSLRSTLRLALSLGRGLSRGLPDAASERDPLDLFGEWLVAAKDSGILLPESMSLATATADGVPSARMVLLKGFDSHGFVFYTNLGSRKARELDANPRAALCFHWAVLQRQVRVEGRVTQLEAEEANAYFQTRPRGSRLAAWASRQSAPLADRTDLERRFEELEERFGDGEIPLPGFWGGYRLSAQVIEFWQGRPNRMHDRLVFERAGDVWKTGRLHP